MTAGRAGRQLAGELTEVQLRNDPFWASFAAIGGYDDQVPDLSPEWRDQWRGRLVDIIVRCGQQEAGATGAERSVLLEAVRDKAVRALAEADSRVDEFSVTTFPLAGPSRMLLIASRTRIGDAASAAAYLTRCRRLPRYLDQYHRATARGRARRAAAGRAAGQRTPSASCAITWRARSATRCWPSRRPRAGPGRRRGGTRSDGSSPRRSARLSAVMSTCWQSCGPWPARRSGRACCTCPVAWPRTRPASATARRCRSTPMSCTGSA